MTLSLAIERLTIASVHLSERAKTSTCKSEKSWCTKVSRGYSELANELIDSFDESEIVDVSFLGNHQTMDLDPEYTTEYLALYRKNNSDGSVSLSIELLAGE